MKPLPRSRVLEFDNQAAAFNAMLTGLRAFSAYVPRSLVARLVRTGDADATKPREAIVTVMFTDIAGFTSLSEQLPANAGAELLNHHFALICDAIDDEGGTVDKFLGDGVMAFFGAPDRLKGHGAAAVRAAIAIREELKADNKAAVEKGRPPLRMRIGIHTGRVIVGNIGAADRVNYTIVGDTVNVSQRLQELGKLVAPDAETAIMISGETAGRLDEGIHLTPSGKHRLRGRGEPIEVFLVGEQADASALRGRPRRRSRRTGKALLAWLPASILIDREVAHRDLFTWHGNRIFLIQLVGVGTGPGLDVECLLTLPEPATSVDRPALARIVEVGLVDFCGDEAIGGEGRRA